MKQPLENDFGELQNFLSCYFGDFWEGRTEKDIVQEAIKESSTDYLIQLEKDIEQFLALPALPNQKLEFIKSANLYFQSEDEAEKFLKRIYNLLKRDSETSSE